MNQLLQSLLAGIEFGTPEEKVSNLLDIGDFLEFSYPKEDDFLEVLQKLIDLLPTEKDPKTFRYLFRNITVAYTQTADFSKINFDAVINYMGKANPDFICSAIYILSMTFNKKYIPVIEKYLKHHDAKVRDEAESALNYF